MADQVCRDDDARTGGMWLGISVLLVAGAFTYSYYKNEKDHDGIYSELDGVHRFDRMIAQYVSEHALEHERIDLDLAELGVGPELPDYTWHDREYLLPKPVRDLWTGETIRVPTQPASLADEYMSPSASTLRDPSRAVSLALEEELGTVKRPSQATTREMTMRSPL